MINELFGNRQAVNRLAWAGAIVMLLLVGLYGALGIYSRPIVDDYCLLALVEEHGVVGAVSSQYWGWSGNVIGLYYQVVGAAFRLHQVWPILLLFLWIGTYFWFLWECLSLAQLPRLQPFIVLISAVITLSLFDMTPNIGQTLYWLNGTANYGPTSALFLLFLTLLIRVTRLGATLRDYLLAVLFVLVAVLGQITMVIYCIGLLVPLFFVAYLYPKVPNRADLMRVLALAVVAGGIGAFIVIASPGNAVREVALANLGLERLSIGQAIIRTGLISIGMLAVSAIVHAPVVHLLLFGIGHFVGRLNQQPDSRNFRSTTLFRIAVPFAGMIIGASLFFLGSFAAVYTTGIPGPPRSWVVPQSLWVIVVLICGYVHGASHHPVSANSRPRYLIVLSLCLAFYSIYAVIQLSNLSPVFKDFAEDIDARIELVEAAVAQGETSVNIPPYRVPVEEILMLSTGDELSCLGAYFGVNANTMEPE